MNKEYAIVTDGSCDLPRELCQEKGITVVPFYVSFDGEKYEKEIVEMPIRQFYEDMVKNPKVFPKSSMPSVQDYMDAFMPIVQEGKYLYLYYNEIQWFHAVRPECQNDDIGTAS